MASKQRSLTPVGACARPNSDLTWVWIGLEVPSCFSYGLHWPVAPFACWLLWIYQDSPHLLNLFTSFYKWIKAELTISHELLLLGGLHFLALAFTSRPELLPLSGLQICNPQCQIWRIWLWFKTTYSNQPQDLNNTAMPDNHVDVLWLINSPKHSFKKWPLWIGKSHL